MTASGYVAACPDADEAVSLRLRAVVEAAQRHLGDALAAVVLAGSLAQGRGVALATPAGPRLLSDLDVYLVVEGRLGDPGAARAAVCRSLAGDPFLLAPLDVGVVEVGYFRSLGPTLPAYQLRQGHRILHERQGLPEGWSRPSLPAAGAARVDADDALRLLHNRLAEHLLVEARARRSPADPYALYHRWKVWLDAPLAWLAATREVLPERASHVDALLALAGDLEPQARVWLERGTRRMAALLEALAAGPLELGTLEELGGRGEAEESTGRTFLRRWAWPYHRALLATLLRAPAADAAGQLARAVVAGAPGAEDVRQGRRWLRRRPVLVRLRQARRWAPLARRRVTPWWRHGLGGIGPERVHLAAAWRFAGLAEWAEPLDGLLPPAASGSGEAVPPPREMGEEGADLWVGGLWSDWIMGGGRR